MQICTSESHQLTNKYTCLNLLSLHLIQEMNDALPSINLIVNCTARKRRIPDPLACARNLSAGNTNQRLQEWLCRLNALDHQTSCQVSDLYCGDGWKTIQTIVSRVQKRGHLKLWIASAGHGLLSADDTIVPYSATFSAGQDDSVTADRDPAKNQQWWNGLTKHSSKRSHSVASVSELAQAFPNTPLLVGVSPDYLWAMMADLLEASEALHNPNLLVIVSAGTKKAGNLTPFLLPCDARLEHRLGGARASLNARIVAYILNRFRAEELRMPILQKHFKNILSRAPEARAYDRKRMTETQVVAFIRKSLQKEPGVAFGALLRRLRDSGSACEYKRFRQLFRTITPPPPSKI